MLKAQRRAFLHRAAISGLCAILLLACAGNEPQDDIADDDITASRTPALSPAPSSPSTPPPGEVPQGWTFCTNEARAYRVAYPADWYTDATGPSYACRWFDPNEFELEPATEPPLTALTINPTQRAFDQASGDLGASDSHRLQFSETVTVGGQQAVRFERVQTRDALFPEGTRTYGYLFDHEGRALYVQTSRIPGTDVDYERNKQVVDRAAATVQFTDGA